MLGLVQCPSAAPGGGSSRDGARARVIWLPQRSVELKGCEELSKQAGLLHSCDIWPHKSLKDLLFSRHCWIQSDSLDIGRK